MKKYLGRVGFAVCILAAIQLLRMGGKMLLFQFAEHTLMADTIYSLIFSLLTYSFYKQPGFILKLFRIRLREIMKINVVPALVIGAGLPLLLYASGGTDNPLNYIVLFVSILSMSLFFSIHYLTIYYLLQPYNAGSEMKSGTYQIIMSVTYFVCFVMMQVQMPILVFGIACIIFCILYSIVACILVYRLASKTFRLRT